MENTNKHIDQLNGSYPEPDIPAEKAWSMMQIQLDAELPVSTGGFSAIVQKMVKSVLGKISIGLMSATIMGVVGLYIAKYSHNQKDGKGDKQETINGTGEKTESDSILNPNKPLSKESYLNKGQNNEESTDKNLSSESINKDLSQVNKNEHYTRAVGNAGVGSDHNKKSVNKNQTSESKETGLWVNGNSGDVRAGETTLDLKQNKKAEKENRPSETNDKELLQVNSKRHNVKSTEKADSDSEWSGNEQSRELSPDRHKVSDLTEDRVTPSNRSGNNKGRIKGKTVEDGFVVDKNNLRDKMTNNAAINAEENKTADYKSPQSEFYKLPSVSVKREKPVSIEIANKAYKTSKLKVDSSLLNKKKTGFGFLNVVDAGLQFNIPLAFSANGHYFTGSNGEKQAYKTFVPSVWVSKKWDRNEVLLNFIPFQQNFINNKPLEDYTDQSDPTDSSTIVNHKTALFKTMGIGLGIQYNYELSSSLVIGAGLNYNQQSSVIIKQVDTRSINNQVLKDSTFVTKSENYIKPYFIATKLELMYRRKRFDTGFNLQIPLTNQSAKPDVNIRSINGQLFFRWRIWTK